MEVRPRLASVWFASDPSQRRAMPLQVAVWFEAESKQYATLARVLEHTARRWAPGWDVEVRKVAPSALQKQLGQAAADNSWKLELWCRAVEESPEGGRVLLIDSDTFVTGPLDDLWEVPFDLAYTVRPEGWRFPINGGVVAVRASEGTRRFMREWLAEDRRMLVNSERRAPWRKKYGGHNQASFGCTLEAGTGAALGLELAALPCAVWNCEDATWAAFKPEATRIVHVKSALRMAAFRLAGCPPRLRPLLDLWHAAEKESRPRQNAA